MQKARRHNYSLLRPLVGVRFQVYCTPLFGVLFTFPSRYSFTIGLSGVFSLTGWCRQIQAGFLQSRPTQVSNCITKGTFTRLSRPMAVLSNTIQLNLLYVMSDPTTPLSYA